MHARQQSWPRIWLMTDERMGDALWHAIRRLPKEAGIVLRHYSLPPGPRAELAREVAGMAEERGLTLAVASDGELARQVGAALVHNPRGAAQLPVSRSVHSVEEAEAARADGAALVFVSPIFATRSHPRRTALGPELALRIAKAAGTYAIALGGMNGKGFAGLRGFHGWAGIGAWLGA
jgi:thiamine-phosphate pyrophosphorylase